MIRDGRNTLKSFVGCLLTSAVEGANALWEPTETAYPSYDGKGRIRVLSSGLQDPDGFVIEVNELLDSVGGGPTTE